MGPGIAECEGKGGKKKGGQKEAPQPTAGRLEDPQQQRDGRRGSDPRSGGQRMGRCGDNAGAGAYECGDPVIARQLARWNVNRRHGWQSAAEGRSAAVLVSG